MGPCARWRCFLARSVAAPALWGVLRGRRGGLPGLRICPAALSFGDREPLASARRGEIAQLVEHTTENRGVPGSIPGLAIDSRLERRGFSLGACRAGIVVCSGGMSGANPRCFPGEEERGYEPAELAQVVRRIPGLLISALKTCSRVRAVRSRQRALLRRLRNE